MSKWAVLKAAIRGKPDEASQRISIHRHDGFSSVLNRRKIFWTWSFRRWIRAPVDGDQLRQMCSRFARCADCPEVRVCFRAARPAAAGLLRAVRALEGEDPGAWRVAELQYERAFVGGGGRQGSRRQKSGSRAETVLCVTVFYHERHFEPLMRAHDLCCYTVPSSAAESGDLPVLSVYTREPPRDAGVTKKGIISHLLHGVDNTGNVRVWTSECILLRVLLAPAYRETLRNRSILELGGGMTALCGLGLALMTECGPVTTTDGHPDSVANQSVCIELCKQKYPEIFKNREKRASNLQARRLRWSRGDELGDLARLSGDAPSAKWPSFDVVIASDCLFFKDFHHDLYWLLKQTTVPGSIVFLLQPPRGGTLEMFVNIIKSENAFRCEIIDDYLKEVSDLHGEYMSSTVGHSYDPDVHYPLLIKLTRL